MAGSDASEDCVLSATTCAGTSARMKRPMRSPPKNTATGSIISATERYSRHSTSTYTPSALSMPSPARAHTDRISANTPSGAAHNTQRTITIIASAIAWKNPTSIVRCAACNRVMAKPRNSANTISGSIALCAAAAMALLGTIATRASIQPTGALCADGSPGRVVRKQGEHERRGQRGEQRAHGQQHDEYHDRPSRDAAGRRRVTGGVHADH